MRTSPIVVLTAMMASVVVGARAADNAKDFNGVWQAFATAPAISRSASAGTFTAEGEIKLADFAARYPNMIEPGSYCAPAGMPSTMTSLSSRAIDITQTPTRISLLAAMENQYRRIYLDERDYPENHPLTRQGYSIGHWDGDTLVIETRLLDEMLTGHFPRTENTLVVERISKMKRDQVTAPVSGSLSTSTIDDNVLAFNLTVTDPTLYAKPQVVTVYYQHIDDNAMPEYDCTATLWQQALDEANP
ncbi:MAG: hypothetical protein V4603_02840 [Pseudomonadota bacterium]